MSNGLETSISQFKKQKTKLSTQTCVSTNIITIVIIKPTKYGNWNENNIPYRLNEEFTSKLIYKVYEGKHLKKAREYNSRNVVNITTKMSMLT